jgi:hypothetical protein
MIAASIPGLLGALLLLGSSPAPTDIQQNNIQDDCTEVAGLVMSGAMRVIGVSEYRTNRALLRELGCHKVPEVRRRVCAELVQQVSQIGSQGTPGYDNIRALMNDMSC